MSAEEQGLTRDRYLVIPRVLIFVRRGDDILLLRGAPNKRTWPNLYNGIGGHVERGETIKEAALREIAEETSLTVANLTLHGIAAIDADDSTLGIIMFIFAAQAETRRVHPSAEGELVWFPVNHLPPNEEMVRDLPIIIPLMLDSARVDQPPFFARYWYDPDGVMRIEINGQEMT